MALFASTAVIETYVRCGRDDSHDGGSEASGTHQVGYFSDSDGSSGSSKQHDNDDDSEHQRLARGAFAGIFGSSSRPVDYHSSRDGVATGAPENGVGDISKYWQNYDLSISEAPKLFSDAEFEAVKRIQQALAVLLLRKRFKERITARRREREVRAAVRVQALVRGIATRLSLPAIREQHTIRMGIKREHKMFKRELRNDGFVVHLYRPKDGALSKVTLKPNGKLNCLCWSRGVAKVKTGSVPLIALKSCYAGYPKQNFPTKSMQARATPLPDKSRTFTIQVNTGKVYVFVAANELHGASHKKLAKGLQSIIDEISSPESFFFDSEGILRRVTSSIFDDRGSIAQLEAMKRQREERFRSRQEEAEARRADLRLKGLTEQDADLGTGVSPLLGPAELSVEAGDAPPPPSRGFGATASFSKYATQIEQGRLASSGIDGTRSGLRMQNQRQASAEGSREERKTMERNEATKGGR